METLSSCRGISILRNLPHHRLLGHPVSAAQTRSSISAFSNVPVSSYAFASPSAQLTPSTLRAQHISTPTSSPSQIPYLLNALSSFFKSMLPGRPARPRPRVEMVGWCGLPPAPRRPTSASSSTFCDMGWYPVRLARSGMYEQDSWGLVWRALMWG